MKERETRMKLMKKSFLTHVLFLVAFTAFSCTLEAQWQARHNLTPAEYQATFNDLLKQGYRLKCVSGYVSNGERYAGVWGKEGGPEGQDRPGIFPARHTKSVGELFLQWV